MPLRSRVWSLIGLCLALAGCSSSTATSTVSCAVPSQTKTWLLSEVDDHFDTHPNASFEFPLFNGAGHPIQLKVRSIGCSCYQLKRAGTRLKVGDPFEIGAAATETLVLHSSRPSVDRVADFNFSIEFEPHPGEPQEVISCHGTLVSISDFRVNPNLLSAEFLKDSPSQPVRFELTRTARQREVADAKPLLSGWPTGAKVEEPQAIGEVVTESNGLWRRSWRVSALIPPPEDLSGAEQYATIRLAGAEPNSPSNSTRLIIRYRSGLSGPKIVHFGEVKTGQPVSRRIQVLARDDRPFRILGPTDKGLALFLHPESIDPMKAHWGNLTLTPSSTGDFREVVQITTDHPEHPSLDIEVRAHVTP